MDRNHFIHINIIHACAITFCLNQIKSNHKERDRIDSWIYIYGCGFVNKCVLSNQLLSNKNPILFKLNLTSIVQRP